MSIVDRPPEDLTARARIRDAALAEFAERGLKGATMKSIADAAGVSVGLVQHHFGSKDGLREACDSYVAETLLGTGKRIVDEDVDPDFLAATYQGGALPATRYLARAITEGSPVAESLFDQGADLSEEFFSKIMPGRYPPGTAKARRVAAVLTAMKLGVITLHRQLSRRLGEDVLDAANAARLSLTVAEVFAGMGEWVDSETGRAVREAAEKGSLDE